MEEDVLVDEVAQAPDDRVHLETSAKKDHSPANASAAGAFAAAPATLPVASASLDFSRGLYVREPSVENVFKLAYNFPGGNLNASSSLSNGVFTFGKKEGVVDSEVPRFAGVIGEMPPTLYWTEQPESKRLRGLYAEEEMGCLKKGKDILSREDIREDKIVESGLRSGERAAPVVR